MSAIEGVFREVYRRCPGDQIRQLRDRSRPLVGLARQAVGRGRHDVQNGMLRTLLNSQLSGRSGLGIPAGLKMGERVVELILFAEDIAGAQSYSPIDALDGLIRPSPEGMGSAEKAVGICKVGACIDGPTEGADRLRITTVRDADEAARKMRPGLTGIARDRAIRADRVHDFIRLSRGAVAVDRDARTRESESNRGLAPDAALPAVAYTDLVYDSRRDRFIALCTVQDATRAWWMPAGGPYTWTEFGTAIGEWHEFAAAYDPAGDRVLLHGGFNYSAHTSLHFMMMNPETGQWGGTMAVLDAATLELLKFAMADMRLSARAYDRILKVSRTIADLAGSERITADHVSEAVHFRNLDRQLWA